MKRPQKAPTNPITDAQLSSLSYPMLGSPKLDGFRCCIVDGIAKTNSMKNIQNTYTFDQLSLRSLSGLDGELIVGPPNSLDAYNNSTGPLRRFRGEPDFKFYVFDMVSEGNYLNRWLKDLATPIPHPRVIKIAQTILSSPEEVISYTTQCTENGYEGAMIRSAGGKYKQGRCTFNEANIFKRKLFIDAEAKIVGFVEKLTNLNPKKTNELGLTSRSSAKAGKAGAGTLGSFILQSPDWPEPFNCGGGEFTHAQRQEIWDNLEKYMMKSLTYKYQKHGSINAPRSPIARRFREEI